MSSVQDMSDMFSGATSFNGDISKWDVSRVNNMAGIFMHATCTYVDGPKHDLSLETGGGFLPFWLELLTRVRTITI